MKKKIIITGGLGYIGTELCKIYSGVSWHHKITVIDNRFISERVNQIRNWNMEFIQGDILDKDLIKKIISLNHQGTLAEGNFTTNINNNYTNNKGSNVSTRLYNRNTEIEHFSSKTIENLNVNDINSINTKTFINIE